MNSRKQNRASMGRNGSSLTTFVNARLAKSPTIRGPEAASYLLFASL
jgi:hypothetical protein